MHEAEALTRSFAYLVHDFGFDPQTFIMGNAASAALSRIEAKTVTLQMTNDRCGVSIELTRATQNGATETAFWRDWPASGEPTPKSQSHRAKVATGAAA